jgi:transcriptional regulator with XRE-family HTH domain
MKHERYIVAAPLRKDVVPVIRRLEEVRLAWGLTLVDVADRIGTSPKYLRDWELGRKLPGAKKLMRWASVLGYEISIWPKEQSR